MRHRKKQAARRLIIDAAEALFAANGLEATTMEDIAERADVSVGTVYNYFGSKNVLLLAGVEEDTNAMVERGASVLARPGTNPRKATQRLVAVYLDQFTDWDPALLREVLSASFGRSGGIELSAGLARMDERLIEQVATLLAGFQDRGRLRDDVEPLEATLLVFSAMVIQLFMYLALEGFDKEMLVRQVNRQVDLAFDGLAKADGS